MSEPKHKSEAAQAFKGCAPALLVFVLIGLAMLITGNFLMQRLFGGWEDVAAEPPSKVFEFVFQRPVPAGVSDILAAGYANLGGSQIWMRFRATDEAIRSLTAGSDPIEEKDAQDGTMMSDAYQNKYRRQVHWEGITRIRKPECYCFTPDPSTVTTWRTLFVDRPRHLIYAYRWNM